MTNIRTSLGIVAAVSFAAPAAAQMGPPVPMTMQQYVTTAAGQPVSLVVRVESFRRDRLRAELLARKTDKLYAVTGKRAELFVADQTPFIMGAMSDVRPGAVLFVSGVATAKGRADVKKIIVLTKYVTVGT